MMPVITELLNNILIWFSRQIDIMGLFGFVMVVIFIIIFGSGTIAVIIMQLKHFIFEIKHPERFRLPPVFDDSQGICDGIIEQSNKKRKRKERK